MKEYGLGDGDDVGAGDDVGGGDFVGAGDDAVAGGHVYHRGEGGRCRLLSV